MILFAVAVVLLVLLSGLSLITGAEFEAEVKAGRRWLAGLVVPARAVGTSARRTPSRVESAAAAGGAPGTVRTWSSPAAPGAVRGGLVDVPDGWMQDAVSGTLIPPVTVAAGRHASTKRIYCGGRKAAEVIERKRVDGHPPWETDHFAIVRPEPYVPEMTA